MSLTKKATLERKRLSKLQTSPFEAKMTTDELGNPAHLRSRAARKCSPPSPVVRKPRVKSAARAVHVRGQVASGRAAHARRGLQRDAWGRPQADA